MSVFETYCISLYMCKTHAQSPDDIVNREYAEVMVEPDM